MRTGVIAAVALYLTSCVTGREPVLPELRDRLSRTTVVLVPGVTGTKLRNRRSGKTVWGNTASFFSPHDGGYAITLPIHPSNDAIESFAPIEQVRLLLYRKEVYGTIVRLMEKNGLRHGDLHNPRSDERFFFFIYDWRRDNVSAARQLAQELAKLGQRRVALICQSNAAYICRYVVKYGDVSLDEAEHGVRHTPAGVTIEKVVLVGTSNGGSIRILHEMDRGRRYFPLIGRTWLPETLFTIRSLFQDLPTYQTDLFLSFDGHPLRVDLFDVVSWKRFGWSVYRRDARRRIERHSEIFGTEDERDEYLREMLVGAKRLHALLQRDLEAVALPRFYSVQSRSLATPERAVLLQRDGEWRMRFAADRDIARVARLVALTSAPGDQHATIESQEILSPAEKAAMPRPTFLVAAPHFEIITTPAAQRWILEILAE